MRREGDVADDKIRNLIDSPDHGRWRDNGRQRIFTPYPSLFEKVEPMELAKYFDSGTEKEVLNLP